MTRMDSYPLRTYHLSCHLRAAKFLCSVLRESVDVKFLFIFHLWLLDPILDPGDIGMVVASAQRLGCLDQSMERVVFNQSFRY